MSMDQPRRPTRAPGGPAGRSPRGSSPAIAVVVALVAAVLGFVILKSLDSDDTSVTTGGGDTGSVDTTPTGTDTAAADTATTTTVALPAVDRAAWNILVANASGVAKSAGALTDQMKSLGYSSMLGATNATDPTPQATTLVYYVIGAEQIGADVAAALGKTAQPMPATLPVAQTDFVGGHVLVMLGTDLAGLPIPGAVVPETTVAPAAGASPNETTSG